MILLVVILIKKFNVHKARSLSNELKYQCEISEDTQNNAFKISVFEDLRKGHLELFNEFRITNNISGRYDSATLELFVCDNEFLNIIEELLIKGELNDYVSIKNAISIITFGIEVKTFKAIDSSLIRKYLGEDLIKNYDIEKANKIVSKLTVLLNNIEPKNKEDILLIFKK